MGLGSRILGFVSAPFVGSRFDGSGWSGNHFSAGNDESQECEYPGMGYPAAHPQQMVPITRIQEPGDTIANRGFGTYTLIPGRALSAQTRLKNMSWELPAADWTHNPDGAPYIVRVPGLPGMTVNLQTQNQFTTQPEYLQPLTNLQIQNDMSWINQFRGAIFGQASAIQQQQQNQLQQDQQTMFPSIFGSNISVNLTGQNNTNG